MATEEIPLQFENPNYEMRTRLEGRDYLLRFKYQERDCFWYLSLFDQDGIAIAEGLRIVTGIPLLSTVVDYRRPLGELFVIDQPADGQTVEVPRDPHFSDLGARHRIYFIPYADLLA